jgi:hypothetical protein
MKKLLFALLLSLFATSSTALAEDDGFWEFGLAPFYLWAIDIDGDLGLAGRTASAQVGFGDVWDNLEGVITARFYGLYKRKIGFLVDFNYLDLGKETDKAQTNLAVSFDSKILNVVGTYRLLDGEHMVDAVAGIRYIWLEAGVDFNDLGVGLEGDNDWLDPIVGGRYIYDFSDRWSLNLYGDIGGFGVGSDISWQLAGFLYYQPWKYVALVGGYRALYSDYQSDGELAFSYDATTHGPLIGLDVKW